MLPGVIARRVVLVAHIVLVEVAVADVALEGHRGIPVVIQRHHNALIVEDVVHAPSLQVEHLSHEPVHHISASVRLVWLVGECWHVRHQLVPNRAGYLVRIELRLSPFLLVWRAQCLAVSIDQERHSLLELQIVELDWCSR